MGSGQRFQGALIRGAPDRRQSRAPRIEVLIFGPSQANQAFHPFGVGELVSDLLEKVKTLTCPSGAITSYLKTIHAFKPSP